MIYASRKSRNLKTKMLIVFFIYAYIPVNLDQRRISCFCAKCATTNWHVTMKFNYVIRIMTSWRITCQSRNFQVLIKFHFLIIDNVQKITDDAFFHWWNLCFKVASCCC